MRRMKEYINKHPKLKRLAKILGVVAIVFSFLFNALIIGSLIINANHQKEDNTTQVLAYGDYKPVKNAYYYDEEGYYSEGRNFLFTTFISNFLYKTYPIYDERVNNVFITDSLTIYVCNWNNFGLTTPQNVSTIIKEIWCEPQTAHYMSGGGSYYVPIDITFYGYLNNEINLEYSIVYNFIPSKYIDTSGNVVNNFFTTGDGAIDYSNFRNVNFDILDGYLMFRQSENITYWNELRGTNSITVEETYTLGYENGFGQGKLVGYDEGYLAGSQGITSNPFTLIKNAFDAVSSILNIEILPNLSLGLLVFLPVVIVVIIVVVKMIRG